jgi:histidine ammonia-lyase
MGGFSARKCLEIIDNVEYVLAIELLCAIQGLYFLEKKDLTTTKPLKEVYDFLRETIEPYTEDRFFKKDLDYAKDVIKSGKIIDIVQKYFN